MLWLCDECNCSHRDRDTDKNEFNKHSLEIWQRVFLLSFLPVFTFELIFVQKLNACDYECFRGADQSIV